MIAENEKQDTEQEQSESDQIESDYDKEIRIARRRFKDIYV